MLLYRIIMRIYRDNMRKLDADRLSMKNRSVNMKNNAKKLKKERPKQKENIESISKNSKTKLPLKKERKQRLELRKNGVTVKLQISVM